MRRSVRIFMHIIYLIQHQVSAAWGLANHKRKRFVWLVFNLTVSSLFVTVWMFCLPAPLYVGNPTPLALQTSKRAHKNPFFFANTSLPSSAFFTHFAANKLWHTLNNQPLKDYIQCGAAVWCPGGSLRFWSQRRSRALPSHRDDRKIRKRGGLSAQKHPTRN